METLNILNVWVTYIFYYVGTPGQLAFFLLYCTRPWRKYGPTRAIWNKSLSLLLLMSQSLIVLHLYGMRHLDWPWWLILYRIICDVYITWAIYYQLFVNIREIRAGYRNRPLRA